MVIKSSTAHIFHVGDTRIFRLHPLALEQLTEDHRVRVSEDQSYLSRALGVNATLEIDYLALPVEAGEIFVLATDGVHEHVDAAVIHQSLATHADNLDAAAQAIVLAAIHNGSEDNLTVQLARIDALPAHDLDEMAQQRAVFDGYRIVRELNASSRSHIYLAVDTETGQQVDLKTPSIDLQGDTAYLDRFLLEEWIARRIDSPYVLKPCAPSRQRQYLDVVMEYIEGQALTQWMLDHPAPDLATVRRIVEQVGRSLQAFHRMDMLHQDLRPANIMIDATGTVKIIDFGATRVGGWRTGQGGAPRPAETPAGRRRVHLRPEPPEPGLSAAPPPAADRAPPSGVLERRLIALAAGAPDRAGWPSPLIG